MGTGLKTNRGRLAVLLLLAAAAVLLFQFVWLAPDTHSDSISVLVMETSGLKPSESHSEILLPDDPRYAQLLALVNSQPYRRYFDQSSRGVQAGGGKSVAFLTLHFYLDGQETLQMELCSEPGSVIRINYQNAGPWPGGKSGAELFGEAMEILKGGEAS